MADANLDALHAHPERHAPGQELMRWRPSPKEGRPWRTPRFFPWLRIAGIWLEQAGFPPGQRVKIQVERGRLVITPDLNTTQTANPATAGFAAYTHDSF